MLDKLFSTFKALLVVYNYNIPGLRLVIGFLLIILIGFYLYISTPTAKIMQLEELKLTFSTRHIILYISYLVLPFAIFFFLRVNNIGKEIDLKFLYVKLGNYIANSSWIGIIADVIFYTPLIYILLLILVRIKKHIARFHFKLHILLRTTKYYEKYVREHFYYSMAAVDGPLSYLYLQIKNDYETIIGIYDHPSLGNKSWYKTFNVLYRPGRKILFRSEEYKQWYWKSIFEWSLVMSKKYQWLKNICIFFDKHLALFTLFSVILYDCIFNNFVLSKLYYVLPFVFIYIIWQTLLYFYKGGPSSVCDETDQYLHTYLYEKLIITQEDGTLVYDNGVYIDSEIAENLFKYMLNDFKYYLHKHIDLREFIEDFQTKSRNL